MLSISGCAPETDLASLRELRIIGGPGKGEGFFREPRGIEAIPADGSCVVVDRSGWIQRYSQEGEVLRSWSLPEWRAGQPIDLTLSPWGTLLVGDTHYRRILEYDLEGQLLRCFGEDAGLALVRGIVAAEDGTIFVADYGVEDRIHRFDRDGRHRGSFGSKGERPDQFLRPEGLTLGENGDLFVVDCGHHRVLRFTREGSFVGGFGQAGDEPGSFLFPFNIATGSGDSLYVVDYRGNRVQRFTPQGALLGVAGGPGREPGRFATPRGIAVLPREEGDLVFVADTSNHRVQRFLWERDR